MQNSFTCCFPHSDRNAIIIDIEISFRLAFEDSSKVFSVKSKALIDTGAQGSCISRRLASACRLEQISAMKILSAQGESIVPVYEIDFSLPNNAKFSQIPVMEISGNKNFDIIIGMDILTRCDFAVSNPKSNLIFTMRTPPEGTPIDFCSQEER